MKLLETKMEIMTLNMTKLLEAYENKEEEKSDLTAKFNKMKGELLNAEKIIAKLKNQVESQKGSLQSLSDDVELISNRLDGIDED